MRHASRIGARNALLTIGTLHALFVAAIGTNTWSATPAMLYMCDGGRLKEIVQFVVMLWQRTGRRRA